MKAKVEKSESEIIYELGIEPGKGKLLIAEKCFFLRTRPGPPTAINPGMRIAVCPESAETLFYAEKARPTNLPSNFEALHNFALTVDGDFMAIEPGDSLTLNEEEALPLLRKGYIREKKEV